MANKIKIKNSTVAGKAPAITDIDRAELAINLADKKIYTKDQNDKIIELNGISGPYADNTAAKSAGLNVGFAYYTSTGDVKAVI